MREEDDPWLAIVKETQDDVDKIRKQQGLTPYQWEKKPERRVMGKETLENITVNGQPVEVYIEEIENSEIEKVKNRELREKSVGIKYTQTSNHPSNTSGARSERRDYAPHHQLSDEVKANINFKSKYQGDKSVHQYVSKQGVANGTIEEAIQDSKEKLSVLRKERQTVELEIARYESILDKLNQAMAIMTGKVTPLGSSNDPARPMRPRGHWPSLAQEIMQTHNAPETKSELIDRLVQQSGSSKPTVYQAVHLMIKQGKIMQDRGKIVWVGRG